MTNRDYIRAEMLKKEPSRELLYDWLGIVLDHWIPKYSICEGHTAPLECFTDKYYKDYNKTIVKACRSGGKTEDTGLYCWLNSRFKSNWKAKIIGGSLDQSRKAYEATQRFNAVVNDLGGGQVIAGEPLISRTRYLNGSEYSILAASPKQARSSHQPELLLDEIDEMENTILNGAMSQPQTMNGHTACWHFTSTEHKIGGLMSEWVDNADRRGFKLYTWCILEVMEGCYDYHCSTCKIDRWCQGRMKPIMRLAEQEQGVAKARLGYNTIEDVLNKIENAETQEDTSAGKIIKPIDIEADLFCKRPSRTGLVYKEFDRNTHVVSSIDISSGWRLYRSFDFGITNPWVCLYIAENDQGQLYIYDEVYVRGKTTPEMVGRLTDGKRYEYNVADPFGQGASDRAMLYQAGIETLAPRKGDIAGGILFVKQALAVRVNGQPGLLIDAKCTNTIYEIEQGYRYPDNVISEIPVKENDHAMDSLRNYLLCKKNGGVRQSLGRFV